MNVNEYQVRRILRDLCCTVPIVQILFKMRNHLRQYIERDNNF